jgi:hypothetical protein
MIEHKLLTSADYINAAKRYDLDPAFLKAVAEVEGGKSGFNHDGTPKILFEGHIFWRRLRARRLNPESILKLFPGDADVLYKKWTKEHYKGGPAEYGRLARAYRIGDVSAYESASWGRFQIMGFHATKLGYESVEDFVEQMHIGEPQHLEAFILYCKAFGLIDEIQRKDYEGFARRYNGPGFAQNQYDTKIAAAYSRYKKEFA